MATLLPSGSSIRLLLALDARVAALLPSGSSIWLLLALDARVAALLQSSLVSVDVTSSLSSLAPSRTSILNPHLTPTSLLYTGLGPVESVSQMLLSTGVKLELGQD
jgi:hypothetical protein